MNKKVRKSKYEKNLRIGIRFEGDKLVLLDGSPLPKLRPNAVGELLVQPDVIESWADRERFTKDDVCRILEKGTGVFLGVSPYLIGDPAAEGLLREPEQMKLKTEYWLVEVRLEQDLCIRIRGDQEARLEKCKCTIPALKRDASSINHAFTIVSERYETQRLSHTGNVFQRAYTWVEPGGWRTLDELRLTAIASVPSRTSARGPSAG
jgi:hypothetical protein